MSDPSRPSIRLSFDPTGRGLVIRPDAEDDDFDIQLAAAASDFGERRACYEPDPEHPIERKLARMLELQRALGVRPATLLSARGIEAFWYTWLDDAHGNSMKASTADFVRDLCAAVREPKKHEQRVKAELHSVPPPGFDWVAEPGGDVRPTDELRAVLLDAIANNGAETQWMECRMSHDWRRQILEQLDAVDAPVLIASGESE